MNRYVPVSVALFVTFVAQAHAAKLVVLAVNSGTDVTAPFDSGQPPTMTPTAKGFLIGLDTQDGSNTSAALGVLNLKFEGIVNRLTAGSDDGSQSMYPKILTRSEAQTNSDGVDYRREDSYVMNQDQDVDPGPGVIIRAWTPLKDGFVESGDTLTITGGFGVVSGTPGGIYPIAYIVTTKSALVTGVLTRGAQSFDVMGDQDYVHPATLDYFNNVIFRPSEPSAIVLAGVFVAGLTTVIVRRRSSARCP